MTVTLRKLSAAEFLELPEEPGRQELVRGEVIMSPRPTRAHAYTLLELHAILHEHVKRHRLGTLYVEVDTVFDTDDVRSPDIQFFQAKHSLAELRDRADILPDLCIEILSPSNIRTDRVEKFELFESKGVMHYWLVDPEAKTIEAYTLVNGKYTAAGRGGGDQVVTLPPFMGLQIPLSQIWHP